MFCSNCGNRLDEGTKFCANCGKKIDDKVVQQNNINTDIPVKQTVTTQQSTAEEYTQKIPTSTGKRNILLLISAIIGSAFSIFFIIGYIRVLVSNASDPYTSPDDMGLFLIPFLAIIFIIPTIFTFLAWSRNKTSYALIGGIIFIFIFFPLGIINHIALYKMKKEKEDS